MLDGATTSTALDGPWTAPSILPLTDPMPVTLVIVEAMLWVGLSLSLWVMLASVRRHRSTPSRPHIALNGAEVAPRRVRQIERRTAA